MHRRKRAGYGDHMTGRLSEAFAAAADFLSRQDPRAGPPEHVGRLLAATGLDRDIGGEDGTRRSDTIGLLRAAARFGGVFRLRSRAAPGMAFFGGFAAPDLARSDAESLRVSLSGAGITPSEAFRACIGEGIEYVAQFETHRLRTGNARDAEAWNRRTYPPELFEWTGQVDGIDWVEAECLSDGESFWIPAPLAMRSASPPSEVDARRWAVGNGCAAGPTAAAARCAALYETIERDAVALWWRGGRPPLEVSQPELDALGATETKITVTNDLDEYTIASLRAAPVNSYGVGTSLVTGSGAPASGMVYKLVSHQASDGSWIPVGKRSDGKATVAGRKVPVRTLDHGVAVEETVYVEEPESLPKPGRGLLETFVSDGVVDPSYLGPEGVAAAREHHAAAIAELPFAAFGLSRGEPVIPTVYV